MLLNTQHLPFHKHILIKNAIFCTYEASEWPIFLDIITKDAFINCSEYEC